MRNYQRLLARIAGWLEPDGRLFVHVFAHRRLAYPFQVGDASTGMERHSSPAESCPPRACCAPLTAT